jgi:hypothetical protein
LTSLPIFVRLALLPIYPIPKPAVADEFGYLLMADTLASGRLANPPHVLREHFETRHVLQQAHYASIYPPGQGLILAADQAIIVHPWYGVLASTGRMWSAVVWMLIGWMEAPWALLGGCMLFVRLGVFSNWMNSYMGGCVPAIGGAIALGALPRLMKTSRATFGAVLAAGLMVIISARPYEGLLFSAAVFAILLTWILRRGPESFGDKLRSVLMLLRASLF